MKLTAINSAFVTVEPPCGPDRPTGKKLLYTFLGTQANHPYIGKCKWGWYRLHSLLAF